mmetsp:Transcript_8277/g.21380  ORF Transcript_8277/g.21380 Transcript_8277/m.21380 type:complete len:215 (-) Transcript_8277:128-772(-)
MNQRGGSAALSSNIREAVAGEHRLRHHAAEGEHREAAVLDLLELHALRILRHEAGPEPEIARRTIGLTAEHLRDGEEGDRLEERAEHEEHHHRAVRHRYVVRGDRSHRRCANAVDAKVSGNEANRSEHREAPVLQLSLAHPLDVNATCSQRACVARVAVHQHKRRQSKGAGALLPFAPCQCCSGPSAHRSREGRNPCCQCSHRDQRARQGTEWP